MSPASISVLLDLPASERAELAMALWNSLTDAERESETVLTPEQETELDRRWEAHLRNPDTAIPWNEVRLRLLDDVARTRSPASTTGA